VSRIIPLDELDGRIPRIGKISAGYTGAKTSNGKTVTFPVKSRTLVFRGSDRGPLDTAARRAGRASESVRDVPTLRHRLTCWRKGAFP
jgi:hypothetical protein